VRAKRSVKLIAKLERGYSNNTGHTIPEWILYLMAKNRAKRIMDLANKFIKQVGARGQGWEFRFALKFGVVYAAMKMGIEAGILPWPKSFPLKIATKCYRKARNAAKTRRERGSDAAATLRRLIDQPRRVVAVALAGNKPTKVTRRTVAIRFIKDDRKKFGILDDALLRIFGSRKAKAIFTAELAKAKLIPNGHGHAGTIQDRIAIKRNGRIIARPRLWVIDAAGLSRFLTNNTQPQ
jgi:hypothetical protein